MSSRLKSLFLAGLACLWIGGSASAQDQTLSGTDIKKLISDRTVLLDTPLGISLPLFYNSNGIVAGNISGFSLAAAFAPKEEGRWWIEGNAMCQQWPSWYKGRRFCFQLSLLGNNSFKWYRDDGASGTGTVQR